jgi:hypothetical protein
MSVLLVNPVTLLQSLRRIPRRGPVSVGRRTTGLPALDFHGLFQF